MIVLERYISLTNSYSVSVLKC